MVIRLIVASVLLCPAAFAAFELRPHGARSTALGGAVVSLRGDLWASFMNPACLDASAGGTLGVEFAPAVFNLQELHHAALAGATRCAGGALAFSASGFGFELYREITFGVALSFRVNERFAVGVGVHSYWLSIKGYGGDHAIGICVGLLADIAEGVACGCSIQNVNRPSIGQDDDPLSQVAAVGVSLRPVQNAMVTLAVTKDVRYPAELCAGVEYVAAGMVALRCGAVNDPSTISAGLGFRIAPFTLDYSYTVHPDLGGSHCVSASYCFAFP